MKCRHCNAKIDQVFIDLGSMPPSNAYITQQTLSEPELIYLLRVFVCTHCWLVQTEDYAQPDELFSPDYAYFSSTSESWLQHAEDYCKNVTDKFNLCSDSLVVEVASNDGYLLKNFVQADIPCLGIEPTDHTADAAEKLKIPVIREFFGVSLANKLVANGDAADLIIGNNVYAHVPDINDFTKGMKLLLKPEGVITLEFPHLMKLIQNSQFDTIYHEHYSYLSLHSVNNIFHAFGLRIFDVEELATHGGSLRIFACHEKSKHTEAPSVEALLKQEVWQGINSVNAYKDFQQKADNIRDQLLSFLLEQRNNGKVVAAYGAAAKGNTLLNYAYIKHDLISFVCDAALAKQGKYMPGSRIPILSPDEIKRRKPDFILILPWNLKSEIENNLAYIREWGGQFAIAVPELSIS